MAKQEKYEGVLDRISSLPDSILCHIMSFLPTIDAVRTAILSTRWRYLFASMPTLDFDFDDYSPYFYPNNINNFKNFVDRLMFFPKQVSLECFRMKYYSWVDDSLRFCGWICAALGRGVKELDLRLYFASKNFPILPTLLFTCRSLVTLKLVIAGDMNVPTNVCLPNLKTLHLKNIRFSDGDSIHRLISGCLVLEDLVMELSMLPNISELKINNLSLKKLVLDFQDMEDTIIRDFNYVIVINAPNLVYFRYIDFMAEGYTLGNMNSLVKADIRIDQFDDEATYDVNRERAATNLLQSICNVQSLRLAIEKAETLIPMHREPVLVFPNLVELEIRNEYEDWQGTWLVEFLHCVPNLNTLLLYMEYAEKGFRSVPVKVPSCLLFHLKEIKISRFNGDKHMFEMISYFLHHATVLEKLKIGIGTLIEKEQLRITKQLLRLSRNSKKCEVVTF